MPGEAYELIARGARYWFLFLMLLIVWRTYSWYRKDKRNLKKRMKLLPDAGFVGELVVIDGAGAVENGKAYPVPHEGTLGVSRSNDVYLPCKLLGKTHLWFRFEDGRGLVIRPVGSNPFNVDGTDWKHGGEELVMLHGSRLYVGDMELRLRLFYGFECGEAVPVQQPAQPDAAAMQQWAMQQAIWQQQMQAFAYWQAARMQAMRQSQTAQYVPEQPVDENFSEYLQEEYPGDEIEYEEPYVRDDTVYMRPESRPGYRPEPQIPREEPTFYPPVMDETPAQSALRTRTPYDGFEEELPDAAQPPRAHYVGTDESEAARKAVWDKYFGGGNRR